MAIFDKCTEIDPQVLQAPWDHAPREGEGEVGSRSAGEGEVDYADWERVKWGVKFSFFVLVLSSTTLTFVRLGEFARAPNCRDVAGCRRQTDCASV